MRMTRVKTGVRPLPTPVPPILTAKSSWRRKLGAGVIVLRVLEGAGVLNRRHVKELLPVPGMYDTGRGPCLLGEHAPRPAP